MTIYRSARKDDIKGCVDILLQGFHKQIDFFLGPRLAPELLTEFFEVFLKSEREGFIVSQTDEAVSGFILTLTRANFFSVNLLFHLPVSLLKFLLGRYGISLQQLSFSVSQSLSFRRRSSRFCSYSSARIVLLAVGEKCRKQGIGTGLLRSGLAYLKKKPVKQVKLEVRTDNPAALHLYKKEGFIIRAEIPTALGSSLIMTRPV